MKHVIIMLIVGLLLCSCASKEENSDLFWNAVENAVDVLAQ